MFTARPSGSVVLPSAPNDLEQAAIAWLVVGLVAAALTALLPAARHRPSGDTRRQPLSAP